MLGSTSSPCAVRQCSLFQASVFYVVLRSGVPNGRKDVRSNGETENLEVSEEETCEVEPFYYSLLKLLATSNKHLRKIG